MSLDLLNELEKRVQSAVGTIEDLKQDIEQLKEENAALTSEKEAWEGRLAELLGKFDLIDSGDNSPDVSDLSSEESGASEDATQDADEQAFNSLNDEDDLSDLNLEDDNENALADTDLSGENSLTEQAFAHDLDDTDDAGETSPAGHHNV